MFAGWNMSFCRMANRAQSATTTNAQNPYIARSLLCQKKIRVRVNKKKTRRHCTAWAAAAATAAAAARLFQRAPPSNLSPRGTLLHMRTLLIISTPFATSARPALTTAGSEQWQEPSPETLQPTTAAFHDGGHLHHAAGRPLNYSTPPTPPKSAGQYDTRYMQQRGPGMDAPHSHTLFPPRQSAACSLSFL